jgi:heme-degrading monooxygenase HmoA
MVAVIFEVIPKNGQKEEYLSLAAALRLELEKIEGFISVERFQSLADPGKILSLSFWKDEESIKKWRALDSHRSAQSSGRLTLFEDYRLRVAVVARDYGKLDRVEAPKDSKAFHHV